MGDTKVVKRAQPLIDQHFKRLSQDLFYYEPTTTASPRSTTDPEFILLMSWLDAQPKHIAKYTSEYQSLFPAARIMVAVINLRDVTWRPISKARQTREPMLDMLLSLPHESRILMHIFSNGGGFSATGLAKTYSQAIGRPLEIQAMILDSMPGRFDRQKSIQAFEIGLPKKFFIRAIGVVLIRIFFILFALVNLVLQRRDRIDVLRYQLNDTTQFAKDAKRLYFYSETDVIIAAEDVVDHADEAREMGLNVRVERFDGTAHCGHMMADRERYWRCVQETWSSAVADIGSAANKKDLDSDSSDGSLIHVTKDA